jgi:hypothetical protein
MRTPGPHSRCPCHRRLTAAAWCPPRAASRTRALAGSSWWTTTQSPRYTVKCTRSSSRTLALHVPGSPACHSAVAFTSASSGARSEE